MANPATTLIRSVSLTASMDWFYRSNFSYAGLRSVVSDLEDGTQMHCWVPKAFKNSKPNLLLVHGFGANAMWQYADLLQHFIPKFNVFVPDLVFFGRSYTSEADRTEKFQARCLMKLMQIQGVEKVSLVGISYGGFVGYSMAYQFPEAVEKAVLCCSGVSLEAKDLEEGLFCVKTLDEATQILVPQTPARLRELINFTFVKPRKGLTNWILSDYINVMCKKYIKEKKELLQEILVDRKFSDLPKISQPTLIIWGEQDKVFPLELGHRLHKHLGSNAEMVVVKDAGHALNIEKTREFIKHLKSFLIEPSPPPPPPPTNTNTNTNTNCSRDATTIIDWWNHKLNL